MVFQFTHLRLFRLPQGSSVLFWSFYYYKKWYYEICDTTKDDNQANTKTEQSELKLSERIDPFSERAQIGSGIHQVLLPMGIKCKNSIRAEAEPGVLCDNELRIFFL